MLFDYHSAVHRYICFFFFQAEDGIRDKLVTGVQTCALPISERPGVGARLLRVTREAGERRPRVALEHLHELACNPRPHRFGVEARLPVSELRGMTGAARLGLERGFERREARRWRALRRKRAAPVAIEGLPERVGAGGGDKAERRQRGDRCRYVAKPHDVERSSAGSRGRVIPLMNELDKGCYPFLRTRSQNSRGKPSRDVASDILIPQVPARLSERKGSTSEPFKPQQAQLPPEGITNKFATGPTGLFAEPVKKLFQVGVQPDGDGRSHVVQDQVR